MKIHTNIKMKLIRSNILHLINKLNRLFTTFGLQQCDSDLKLSIIIAEKCIRWTTCEGRSGLARYKQYSQIFTRGVMGITEPQAFSSTNTRHLHRCFMKAKNSRLALIYWVSVFNVHRLFTLKPDENTSTITSRFNGKLFSLARYSPTLYKVTKSFSSFLGIDENWSATFKWHISGSAGPNGQVAYTRYLDDLYAIRQEGLYWKIGLFLYSLPISNSRETFEALKDAIFQSWTEGGDKQPIHSRLAFLSDKSGKTRVVAMVDILSQSCLKVVHQRCNRILRHLETDGTFNQDKQRARVKKWSEQNLFLASIDLSAATDRLPVLYQVFVLIGTRILTPLQALGWLLVTVKRTFVVNTSNGLKHVRYKVGQPMGALSSWPVMAISHHVLVWWAYKLTYPLADPSSFNQYCILGDDLVICDEAVSKNYLALISALGVDVSMSKSFFSYGLAEFAKSLFLRGSDITPFPLSPLKFEKNTIVSSVQVILTECHKRKLMTTMSTLLGISPKRWSSLVHLAALSPLSPKSALDLRSREDYGVFFSFLLIQRIKYYSQLNTVMVSTHAFAINDPGKSGKRLASPFLQIGQSNGERYPVRRLEDAKRLVNPIPMLGKGWISYCSIAWPEGLPLLGDDNMVPGPVWKKEIDDIFVRSSLLKLEKLLPGYFTLRCVGPQVGD